MVGKENGSLGLELVARGREGVKASSLLPRLPGGSRLSFSRCPCDRVVEAHSWAPLGRGPSGRKLGKIWFKSEMEV